MSAWDEKAADVAEVVALEASQWSPAVATRFGGFMAGARWQREALLSDEAVERAARALCAAAGETPDSNELWDEEPPWTYYTDEARAMLTAAIEGDET